jgi:hypothetical protein
VISGDGVDQVMTRDTSADYLPLVSASFERAGVVLRPPFLDERVVAHLSSVPADPGKQVLRELGALLPIPRSLVTEPKTSLLAPPVDLDVLVPPAQLAATARELGLDPPTLSTDREHVRWVTLALLSNAFYAPP